MSLITRILRPCSLLLTTGAALLAAPPAGAQDIAACRAIADDKARLACFDQASERAVAAPAPAPAPAPAAPSSLLGSFGLDSPPPTKPEDFGRSSMPPTAPQPVRADEPAPITSITAKVVQIIDPYGKPRFVLDNNQVWGALNYIHINPRSNAPSTVTIENSLVGYLMRLNDSSAEFNVKRLK